MSEASRVKANRDDANIPQVANHSPIMGGRYGVRILALSLMQHKITTPQRKEKEMTTADPKAAARRRRAKKVRKGKHDAKVFFLGALVGSFAFAMFLLSTGGFSHPSSTTTEPTTATVVHKAYKQPPAPPIITEDSPGFDCRYNGNHICGPGNSNHVKAGLYNRNGKMALTWRELKDWGIWNYGPPANADDGFKAPKKV